MATERAEDDRRWKFAIIALGALLVAGAVHAEVPASAAATHSSGVR
ncbi:hypothetical protein ACK8OR_05960 [Jannaschia sp. KMU-145]